MHLTALPERFPGRTIAAVGFLFALAYGASLVILPKADGRLVVGDALHHYVQLRSAVFDRDLHFENEYVRLYGLRGGEPGTGWVFEPTPTGHVRNRMPVGPALLWAPAFLAVAAAMQLANLAGAAYALDGYGRAFQASASFTGIAAAAAGVWFSFLAAAQLTGRRAAIWGCLIVWLSSSALYYALVSPAYSHSASLLATGLFWFAFVRSRLAPSAARYALLGALAGLAALMRWQDAVLLLVVLADLAWRLREGIAPGRLAAWGLACVASALVVFTPQMIVWQALYAQPLAIPQGSGFMRWTTPALTAVLLSTRRGLFTWTPIVAVAAAGLVPLFRRDRLVGLCAILFFVVSWYVNAAVADWWAGEAFGARRFVSCFPVFALGLAALLEHLAWRPGRLALAGAAFTIHTVLLLLQYQAFLKGLRHVVPYPDGVYELWLARFRAPFDLIAWWVQ